MSRRIDSTDLRRYRSQAAERLAELALHHERDDGEAYQRSVAMAEAVDWQALETLPHWCLLDQGQREHLQYVAGALFSLPLWRDCIDGATLRAINHHIGSAIFRRLLDEQWELPIPVGNESFTSEGTPRALQGGGAAVLLGTLPVVLWPLFAPVVGEPAGVVSEATADRLFRLAATLLADGAPEVTVAAA